jgi:hypothetical protein
MAEEALCGALLVDVPFVDIRHERPRVCGQAVPVIAQLCCCCLHVLLVVPHLTSAVCELVVDCSVDANHHTAPGSAAAAAAAAAEAGNCCWPLLLMMMRRRVLGTW